MRVFIVCIKLCFNIGVLIVRLLCVWLFSLVKVIVIILKYVLFIGFLGFVLLYLFVKIGNKIEIKSGM